jgi:hypothetical protein
VSAESVTQCRPSFKRFTHTYHGMVTRVQECVRRRTPTVKVKEFSVVHRMLGSVIISRILCMLYMCVVYCTVHIYHTH